jgi:Fungal Zn(2)-Cys(6) binuclear cluster domain/Zinc finger, C2H2 type
MAGGPSLSNLLHSNPLQPETLRTPTVDHRLSSTASQLPALSHPQFHSHSQLAVAGPVQALLPNPSPVSPTAPRPPPLTIQAQSQSHHNSSSPTNPSQRSHSSNTSLYQCADCQRRYSRPEHLARHIQTHTLGKRFACQVCGKAFARADFLKRHTTNHENDNDSTKKRRRTTTEPNTGRVSHACRPCASARVKCEELKPCTRCRTRKLNCEYSSSEAGSAAAMHLLHLSANAHSSVSSSPNHGSLLKSPSLPPPNHSSQQRVRNTAESPSLTQNSSSKGDEAQLPTPDTVMEHGRYHISPSVSWSVVIQFMWDAVSQHIIPKSQSFFNAVVYVSSYPGMPGALLLFVVRPLLGLVATTCKIRCHHPYGPPLRPCESSFLILITFSNITFSPTWMI